MRKIEQQMIHAVTTGKDFTQANTKVKHTNDRAYVYLHGHNIAQVFDDYLIINDCGWQTVTTKSRLNALLHALTDAGISQNKYIWHLTGGKGSQQMKSREWYMVESPAI
jgi:muramoyltetrapeptide carboxypeptidase LdcA involved in peptidoglycan recycling